MKGFLAGVGAATVLFALTSFAYWSGSMGSGAPPSVARRPGPITISDLPLNRSFQAVVPVNAAGNASLTFPPGAGVAITQLSGGLTALNQPPQDFYLNVVVNGAVVALRRCGAQGNGEIHFDPPIIVPPGGTITFTTPNAQQLSLGGWTLALGDV